MNISKSLRRKIRNQAACAMDAVDEALLSSRWGRG
jgi:hypothetical protein